MNQEEVIRRVPCTPEARRVCVQGTYNETLTDTGTIAQKRREEEACHHRRRSAMHRGGGGTTAAAGKPEAPYQGPPFQARISSPQRRCEAYFALRHEQAKVEERGGTEETRDSSEVYQWHRHPRGTEA